MCYPEDGRQRRGSRVMDLDKLMVVLFMSFAAFCILGYSGNRLRPSNLHPGDAAVSCDQTCSSWHVMFLARLPRPYQRA
jgi:hypothetical protein